MTAAGRRISCCRIAAAVLCALAWWLRLHRLGAQSLWYDEALSVSQATEPLRDMVIELARSDVHPPLYFALLHGWMLGAGSSEFAIRTLSAWWSTLAVAALLSLGTRLAGYRVGLLAGALGCLSPMLVYYGQETRMYALLACLSVLGGYAFLRAADGQQRWWLVYVAVLAAALWTQLYAALLFTALNLWYIARAARSLRAAGPDAGRWSALRRLLPWLSAQTAVLLLFCPWLPVAYGNAQGYTSPGHGSSLGRILEQTAVVFTLGYPADGTTTVPGVSGQVLEADLAHWLLLPFLVALALGLMVAIRRRRLLLVAWLVLPLAGIYLLSMGKRDFNTRYVIEAAPAFLVLTAMGLTWCWQQPRTRLFGIVLSMALVGVSVSTLERLYRDPAYARDDNRQAVQLVAQGAVSGAGVVLDAAYADLPFNYYAHGRWPLSNLPTLVFADPAAAQAGLRRFTAGRPQIWLVLWQDYYSDPQRVVWDWLLQHFYASDWRVLHGGIQVLRFDTMPAAGDQPSGATFGGALQLVAYQVAALRDASNAQIDLYWRVLARPSADVSIAAHLLDGAGNDYGDADGPPADGRMPATSFKAGQQFHTIEHLKLRPWTAGGAYRLQVLVYDPRGAGPLIAAGPGAAGDSAMLSVALPPGPATPPTLPTEARPVDARFAGVGTLSGYSAISSGHAHVLTLFWQAAGPTQPDLKVFAHALDAAGHVIATGDSDPAAGAAPVRMWTAAELVRDPHHLTLATNQHVVAYEVGLYDPGTGVRVPVQLPDGNVPPDRAVRLLPAS